MKSFSKFRVIFLLSVLLLAGLIVLLREHRPSFLRPGVHLRVYVSTEDGYVSIVDVPELAMIGHVFVGQGISGMREHPRLPEIWGASSTGGYVWVLDARTNQALTKIPVGPLPYSIDFSPDGKKAYTTSFGSDMLVEIDCLSR